MYVRNCDGSVRSDIKISMYTTTTVTKDRLDNGLTITPIEVFREDIVLFVIQNCTEPDREQRPVTVR